MADTLYRYDEPTGQWVVVTSVNRIEVSGGGSSLFNLKDFPFTLELTNYIPT